MAGIMASETRKQKAIWMNLLFCRMSNQQPDSQHYIESSDEESDEDLARKKKRVNRSKMVLRAQPDDDTTEHSLFGVFKSNLEMI
jgi:hypothetical protein